MPERVDRCCADNPDAFQKFGSTLRRVADPRVYPAVALTVEAGVFDEVGSFEEDNEADFDFGLPGRCCRVHRAGVRQG